MRSLVLKEIYESEFISKRINFLGTLESVRLVCM